MFIFERERERERERDRAWAGEGQRERETQNPQQAAGSELSAQPNAGLELKSCEIMTWAEVGRSTDFGSGHDLVVCGFGPHVGLCVDSLEPGACLGFCVSLSLTLPRSLSVFLCLKNK